MCWLKWIDEGPGFDPKTVPNPFVARQQGQVAKRGLFFMEACS